MWKLLERTVEGREVSERFCRGGAGREAGYSDDEEAEDEQRGKCDDRHCECRRVVKSSARGIVD